MFALADRIPSAPSSSLPWHRALRPLIARAAGLMKVAAVAGGAIVAGGAGELGAATFEIVLDPVPDFFTGKVFPGTRGRFTVPDALLGKPQAGKIVPFAQFTLFEVTIDNNRFNLPGDRTLGPEAGVLLDINGQPYKLTGGGKPANLFDMEPDPQFTPPHAILAFADIGLGTGGEWRYDDYTGRGDYNHLLGGRYRIEGVPAINPAAPNIVIITHGLAPGGDFDHPGYLHHLTVAINDRLKADGLNTLDTHIIEYEWPEAVVSPNIWKDAYALPATIVIKLIEYTRAFKATEIVGNRLALKIKTYIDNGAKIKPGYNPNIHFIGHSLGSMVNAFAARQLNVIRKLTVIKQFTILDDPLGVGYNDPTLPEVCLPGKDKVFYAENQKFFYNVLSATNVKYVENFYATVVCPKILVLRYGGPLPGAGPIDKIAGSSVYQGVRVPNTNHNTIHSSFYAKLIRSGVTIPGTPVSRTLKWKSPVLSGWKPDIVWNPAIAREQRPVIPK